MYVDIQMESQQRSENVKEETDDSQGNRGKAVPSLVMTREHDHKDYDEDTTNNSIINSANADGVGDGRAAGKRDEGEGEGESGREAKAQHDAGNIVHPPPSPRPDIPVLPAMTGDEPASQNRPSHDEPDEPGLPSFSTAPSPKTITQARPSSKQSKGKGREVELDIPVPPQLQANEVQGGAEAPVSSGKQRAGDRAVQDLLEAMADDVHGIEGKREGRQSLPPSPSQAPKAKKQMRASIQGRAAPHRAKTTVKELEEGSQGSEEQEEEGEEVPSEAAGGKLDSVIKAREPMRVAASLSSSTTAARLSRSSSSDGRVTSDGNYHGISDGNGNSKQDCKPQERSRKGQDDRERRIRKPYGSSIKGESQVIESQMMEENERGRVARPAQDQRVAGGSPGADAEDGSDSSRKRFPGSDKRRYVKAHTWKASPRPVLQLSSDHDTQVVEETEVERIRAEQRVLASDDDEEDHSARVFIDQGTGIDDSGIGIGDDVSAGDETEADEQAARSKDKGKPVNSGHISRIKIQSRSSGSGTGNDARRAEQAMDTDSASEADAASGKERVAKGGDEEEDEEDGDTPPPPPTQLRRSERATAPKSYAPQATKSGTPLKRRTMHEEERDTGASKKRRRASTEEDFEPPVRASTAPTQGRKTRRAARSVVDASTRNREMRDSSNTRATRSKDLTLKSGDTYTSLRLFFSLAEQTLRPQGRHLPALQIWERVTEEALSADEVTAQIVVGCTRNVDWGCQASVSAHVKAEEAATVKAGDSYIWTVGPMHADHCGDCLDNELKKKRFKESGGLEEAWLESQERLVDSDYTKTFIRRANKARLARVQQEASQPVKNKRGHRGQRVKRETPSSDDDETEEEEAPAPPRKRGRPSKTRSTSPPPAKLQKGKQAASASRSSKAAPLSKPPSHTDKVPSGKASRVGDQQKLFKNNSDDSATEASDEDLPELVVKHQPLPMRVSSGSRDTSVLSRSSRQPSLPTRAKGKQRKASEPAEEVNHMEELEEDPRFVRQPSTSRSLASSSTAASTSRKQLAGSGSNSTISSRRSGVSGPSRGPQYTLATRLDSLNLKPMALECLAARGYEMLGDTQDIDLNELVLDLILAYAAEHVDPKYEAQTYESHPALLSEIRPLAKQHMPGFYQAQRAIAAALANLQ